MIAAPANAPLTLVHVMNTETVSAYEAMTGGWSKAESFLQRARSQLAESAERLRARYQLNVEFEVLVGRPHAVVAEVAEARDVGLVVIGAHDNEALRYTLLGTIGARMLRAIRRPILVVRNKTTEPYAGVLAAMDFSDASIAAMQLAVRIVPNARLAVLHVLDTHLDGLLGVFGAKAEDLAEFWTQARVDTLAKMEALIAHLPERSVAAEAEVQQGKPAEVVLHRSRRAGVDLLALGRHGAIRAIDVFVGGVVRQIVNRSDCDVLVSGITGAGA